MKRFFALCIFVCAFVAVSTFAQDPKVVVIPLNSSQKVIAGNFDGYATLTDSNTTIMSGTDVSLPVAGTCLVSADIGVQTLASGSTVNGPYLRTARQTGAAGTPDADNAYGGYALYVTGGSNSTAVSASFVWDMTAGTIYRFGCAILVRPADWATATATCRVTWSCSAK